MTCRVDSTLIAGACVVGDRGLGVLGSVIRATTGPSSGPHGAGYLYNDWQDSSDDGKEFRGLIVAPPSAGTFAAYEDGSFILAGAPDGAYTFVYRLYVDGVDLGAATGSITVGTGVSITVNAAAVLAISFSLTAAAAITFSMSPPFTYGRVGPFTRVPTQEEQAAVTLLARYEKQPVEVLDYPVDFTDWMKGRVGDSIVSYSITAAPTGMTRLAQGRENGVVTAVWAGGVAGVSYRVTTTVTTSAGLVKSAEFQVKVKEV